MSLTLQHDLDRVIIAVGFAVILLQELSDVIHYADPYCWLYAVAVGSVLAAGVCWLTWQMSVPACICLLSQHDRLATCIENC